MSTPPLNKAGLGSPQGSRHLCCCFYVALINLQWQAHRISRLQGYPSRSSSSPDPSSPPPSLHPYSALTCPCCTLCPWLLWWRPLGQGYRAGGRVVVGAGIQDPWAESNLQERRA